jgi:hypothetical protein
MKACNWFRILGVTIAMFGSGAAHALTTAGAGSVIVIPNVAQTGSYSTEVFVRNFNSESITVNVLYYAANDRKYPGLQSCSPLVIPSQRTVPFTLSTQCTVPVDMPSHYGMLVLEDAASEKIHTFTAYSRTQTPGGNGYSVEGFPVGNFSGGTAGAIGLKRQEAAPKYQTNCFVGALGEAVEYRIQLFDESTGLQIGSDITGPTLAPYQIVRQLDIFARAGLPLGDYSNVRARFSETGAGTPAFVGYCTVQESTFFGADFRIAKSTDANDNRQRREICYAQDTCGTLSATPTNLASNRLRKNIHWLLIAQPDYVKCELVSDRLADLEMQLRRPGDPFDSLPFVTSPPYSSGGDNQTSFYIFTGHRSDAIIASNGYTTRWYIDVGFREGGDSTGTISYGITCRSGNGVSVPWYRAEADDTF